MIDTMNMIQQSGTENYDCKTIIGVMGGVIAVLFSALVKVVFMWIKDLKQKNAMIDAILDTGTKRREAPDV